jgi:hypothetical protein
LYHTIHVLHRGKSNFHWGIPFKSARGIWCGDFCVGLNSRIACIRNGLLSENQIRNHLLSSCPRDDASEGVCPVGIGLVFHLLQSLRKKNRFARKNADFAPQVFRQPRVRDPSDVSEIRQNRNETFVGIYASIVGSRSNYALNQYCPLGGLYEILY